MTIFRTPDASMSQGDSYGVRFMDAWVENGQVLLEVRHYARSHIRTNLQILEDERAHIRKYKRLHTCA